MPDKCSVPNCKSNYDSTKDYISVFQLPKDKAEQELWLQNIPRDKWSPGPSAKVCELHFAPQHISKVIEYVDAQGIRKTFPRKKGMLLPGAVPTMFLNFPSYLSTVPATELVHLRKRRKIGARHEEEAVGKLLKLND